MDSKEVRSLSNCCLAKTGFRQIKVNYRQRIKKSLYVYYLKCFIVTIQNDVMLNYIDE